MICFWLCILESDRQDLEKPQIARLKLPDRFPLNTVRDSRKKPQHLRFEVEIYADILTEIILG